MEKKTSKKGNLVFSRYRGESIMIGGSPIELLFDGFSTDWMIIFKIIFPGERKEDVAGKTYKPYQTIKICEGVSVFIFKVQGWNRIHLMVTAPKYTYQFIEEKSGRKSKKKLLGKQSI